MPTFERVVYHEKKTIQASRHYSAEQSLVVLSLSICTHVIVTQAETGRKSERIRHVDTTVVKIHLR